MSQEEVTDEEGNLFIVGFITVISFLGFYYLGYANENLWIKIPSFIVALVSLITLYTISGNGFTGAFLAIWFMFHQFVASGYFTDIRNENILSKPEIGDFLVVDQEFYLGDKFKGDPLISYSIYLLVKLEENTATYKESSYTFSFDAVQNQSENKNKIEYLETTLTVDLDHFLEHYPDKGVKTAQRAEKD